MITLLKSYVANPVDNNTIKSRAVMKLTGLSTDEKPLIEFKGVKIENGSSFIQIDTSKTYKYDEENNEWIEQVKGSNKDIIIENNALLTYINEVTGGEDTNLSDAIATLADGYGGISVDDFASGNKPSGDVIINVSKFKSNYVFTDCKNIESVTFINPNLIAIPNSCFSGCTGLKTVRGEYITSVEGSAFYKCSSLKNINLPNVNYCDSSAFQNCSSLEEISLPKLIKAPFQFVRGCTSLRVVKLASCTGFTNSFQFIACGKLTDVYLPNDASTYSGSPWGAPTTCTFHYNTTFDENGEPVIE